jgi:hypothetical protein
LRAPKHGEQVNFNVKPFGLEQPQLIGRQQWEAGVADEVDGSNSHASGHGRR